MSKRLWIIFENDILTETSDSFEAFMNREGHVPHDLDPKAEKIFEKYEVSEREAICLSDKFYIYNTFVDDIIHNLNYHTHQNFSDFLNEGDKAIIMIRRGKHQEGYNRADDYRKVYGLGGPVDVQYHYYDVDLEVFDFCEKLEDELEYMIEGMNESKPEIICVSNQSCVKKMLPEGVYFQRGIH